MLKDYLDELGAAHRQVDKIHNRIRAYLLCTMSHRDYMEMLRLGRFYQTLCGLFEKFHI